MSYDQSGTRDLSARRVANLGGRFIAAFAPDRVRVSVLVSDSDADLAVQAMAGNSWYFGDLKGCLVTREGSRLLSSSESRSGPFKNVSEIQVSGTARFAQNELATSIARLLAYRISRSGVAWHLMAVETRFDVSPFIKIGSGGLGSLVSKRKIPSASKVLGFVPLGGRYADDDGLNPDVGHLLDVYASVKSPKSELIELQPRIWSLARQRDFWTRAIAAVLVYVVAVLLAFYCTRYEHVHLATIDWDRPLQEGSIDPFTWNWTKRTLELSYYSALVPATLAVLVGLITTIANWKKGITGVAAGWVWTLGTCAVGVFMGMQLGSTTRELQTSKLVSVAAGSGILLTCLVLVAAVIDYAPVPANRKWMLSATIAVVGYLGIKVAWSNSVYLYYLNKIGFRNQNLNLGLADSIRSVAVPAASVLALLLLTIVMWWVSFRKSLPFVLIVPMSALVVCLVALSALTPYANAEKAAANVLSGVPPSVRGFATTDYCVFSSSMSPITLGEKVATNRVPQRMWGIGEGDGVVVLVDPERARRAAAAAESNHEVFRDSKGREVGRAAPIVVIPKSTAILAYRYDTGDC